MFDPVDPSCNVPELEHEVIKYWEERDIVQKYLHRNDNSKQRWSFIDGPITANGQMGVHHAWGRTYKDLWQRYHTMLGHQQRYQNGFDCQGLWVEVTVEQQLGFKSKRDIEELGIAEFVRKCKESVFSFAEIQTRQSKRLGYFMDWDNSYFTLSDANNYAVWLFLKTCHEKGWLYKGTDVMPWCVRCGTGISEQEINTTEYEGITHTSVYVKFPLISRPNEYLLVWTTTPWTLSSNVAAAVNPGNDPDTGEPVTYVRARHGEDIVYAAKNSLTAIGTEFEILDELSGSDMLGWRYEGPFDELPAEDGVDHRVIPWTDVSATEGTGIVHIAPGAGKEDFALSKLLNLPVVAPLDENGVYVDGFGWLTGRHVLDVADDVVKDLQNKGLLFRAHRFSHRYPVCWRCHTQLVFRLVDEWFISMGELRQRMIRATEKITWLPTWGLDRELDWLRNMDDWMISKKRYWGLALPIFECECGSVEVLGGKEELFERAVEGLIDLESPHRPWIDAVRIQCSKCGELVKRIKDVGNPWLDAGIVPFSTLRYVDDREYWQKWFPADFITESLPGQFRNWFYSLIAQSAALENTNSFRTVLGYGALRDLNGREMHKSWGNLIPFDEAADSVGADVMRWLFCTHPPETNLNFGYSVLDSVKSRLLILWNTLTFFVTYANIDGFTPAAHHVEPLDRPLLDRWIIARLNELVLTVREGLDTFDARTSFKAVDAFIEDLSTWYVRRSRRRFWKSGLPEADTEKSAAYETLYECLRTLVVVMAPFVPHISEHIYQTLIGPVRGTEEESVHLCDFPSSDANLLDQTLLKTMEAARRVVSLGRAAREQAGLKVRQPLAVVYVAVPTDAETAIQGPLRDVILEELNVKTLEPAPSDAEFVDYRIRPNLPLIGRRYGPQLPLLRKALDSLAPSTVASTVAAGRAVHMEHDGHEWTLAPEEILVEAIHKEGFAATGGDGYLVALDTTLTPALRFEGLARELTRAINDLRREENAELDDRIVLVYSRPSEGFESALSQFSDYIKRETLAESIMPVEAVAPRSKAIVKADDESVEIGFDILGSRRP